MKVVLLVTICWLSAQLANATSYPAINCYSRCVMVVSSRCVMVVSSNELTYYQLPSEIELTSAELEEMKRILLRALSQYNKKYGQGESHIGPLDDYGVQYKIFLAKDGKKEVWINGFCKNPSFMYDITTLTTLPVSGLDVGSCYFNTIINLAKRKASRIVIHGLA